MHDAWLFCRVTKQCFDRIVRRLIPQTLKCNARIAAKTRQFRLAEVDYGQVGFSKLVTNGPNATDKCHFDSGSGKPQSFIDCDPASATLDVAEIVQNHHLKIAGWVHDGFNESVSDRAASYAQIVHRLNENFSNRLFNPLNLQSSHVSGT